jgi:hypothetical protein
MERLNRYLLTHYPLLWNTRVVWVLLANVIIHLLFFLGGLAAVNRTNLINYRSPERVGGESLYTISVLFSLVVLIVWCIFYLRNNAFKSFYRIDKGYLAKEFGLILLIIFTSTCYPQSYEFGVRLGVRNITGKEQMMKEVNDVNRAMVYVPLNNVSYFVLNTCEAKKTRRKDQPEYIQPYDSQTDGPNVDSAAIRRAMQQPDAYSYLHYCSTFLPQRNYQLEDEQIISYRNRQWLLHQRRDSIEQSILRLFTILNKYDISYNLDEKQLVNAVFQSADYRLSTILPTERHSYENEVLIENKYFLTTHDLTSLYDFIAECQPGGKNIRDVLLGWNVYGYIALLLAIVLLCYRRFSRKVFLISVVGSLVWMILVGIITMGGDAKNAFPVVVLLLCPFFLLFALILLAQKNSKTATGVLLSWHAYLAPFIVMLIVLLINNYRDSMYYSYNYVEQDCAFATLSAPGWLIIRQKSLLQTLPLLPFTLLLFLIAGQKDGR